MKNTIMVLLELKSKNLSHLDIKPCNILLDEIGNIKLADFGTSK